MRGKDFRCLGKRTRSRITPAYAGKSSFTVLDSFLYWDHPRACGEKTFHVQNDVHGLGSPPRMRGKVERCVESSRRSGITPAHAGKSNQPVCGVNVKRDHPRACGEKKSSTPRTAPARGSPPRMRGKEEQCGRCQARTRITPAHAGKREEQQAPEPRRKDHPRACGEKSALGVGLELSEGSPPRMRGKVDAGIAEIEIVGITPAHAGKSASAARQTSRRWDHPRACGEKRFASI